MNDLEFVQKFIQFEEKNNFFNIEFDDIPIWELIRRDIFLSLQKDIHNVNLVAEKHGVHSLYKFFKSFVKSIFFRNPVFRKKEIEILFFSNSRKKIVNDKYVNIYIDDICKNLNTSYAILERDFKYAHFDGDLVDKTYYYDFISFPVFIISKLSKNQKRFQELAESINQKVQEEYGQKVNGLHKVINEKINLFKYSSWLHRFLLKKIQPSKIVLYVSYNVYSQSLVHTAKNLGIPTYELQHGIIGPIHNAYNFPDGINLKTFPEFLLTWGKYHTKDVSLPLPSKNVIDVGFPYLESQVTDKIYSKMKKVTVISQRRDDIAIYASEIAEKLPDFEIIFKAHPTEYQYAKEKYQFLGEHKNVKIVTDESVNLYTLFNKSIFVVGVNSTALMEALAFHCKVGIMDLPGSDIYLELIDDVNVFRGNSDKLVCYINNLPHEIESEYAINLFFNENSICNIKNILEV